MVEEQRRGRWLGRLAFAGAVLVAGGGVGWATATVFAPPAEVLDEAPFTFVTAESGEVGSILSLNTVAEWRPELSGTNLAAGVVTTVDVASGAEIIPGQRLYSVDLRPVVVARGEIPAFRDLSRGLVGPDVAQLQELLVAAGTYTGSVDGKYQVGTERAVKAWQQSLGVEASGSIQRSDIIFLTSLPTRVTFSEELFRGAHLAGGEAVMAGLGSTPDFTVPISDEQSGLISDGDRVEIASPAGSTWGAEVAGRLTDENGQVSLVLKAATDESICGSECGIVPVGDRTLLASRIVTQEPVIGIVVPSAALLAQANGGVVVIDRDGASHAVSVAASSRGMSVVEGILAGLSVQVPATE